MSARDAAGEASVPDSEESVILIVEDEPKVAEVYEQYLNDEYDVRVAHNGAEALVEFGPAVDVVLLDRRMPGMSGDEVLEHLREWSEDCYIAMVTAIDPADDILGMPFDDYLTKPVTRAEMLDTVERLLLIDRYERLLKEYYSVTRKHAAFASATAENADVKRLEDRREELLTEMRETIDAFDSDAVADVFRDLHELE